MLKLIVLCCLVQTYIDAQIWVNVIIKMDHKNHHSNEQLFIYRRVVINKLLVPIKAIRNQVIRK